MADNPNISVVDNKFLQLGNSKYRKETILAAEVITEGVLLGRILLTGKLIVSSSGATDGSAIPIAVAIGDVDTLADAITTILIGGDVDEGQLVLDGSDTLETVIGSFTIRDHLRLGGIYTILVDDVFTTENTV